MKEGVGGLSPSKFQLWEVLKTEVNCRSEEHTSELQSP